MFPESAAAAATTIIIIISGHVERATSDFVDGKILHLPYYFLVGLGPHHHLLVATIATTRQPARLTGFCRLAKYGPEARDWRHLLHGVLYPQHLS